MKTDCSEVFVSAIFDTGDWVSLILQSLAGTDAMDLFFLFREFFVCQPVLKFL